VIEDPSFDILVRSFFFLSFFRNEGVTYKINRESFNMQLKWNEKWEKVPKTVEI